MVVTSAPVGLNRRSSVHAFTAVAVRCSTVHEPQLAGVAADVGAGEPKRLAQHVHEQRVVGNVDGLRRAVHRECYLHCPIPPNECTKE